MTETRDVAVIVIHREKRFLVVTNRKHEGFTLPGGSIEPGESPQDAAERELLEETGCESLRTTHIGTFELPWKGKPYRIYCFLGDIGTQEPSVVEEGSLPFWVTRNEILDLDGDCLCPVISGWFMGKLGMDQ